jgi:hypothetical protein
MRLKKMHLNKQSDEIVIGVDKSSFIDTARMVNSSGTSADITNIVAGDGT